MKNTAKSMNIPLSFSSGKTAAARLGIPPDVIAWCRQNGCAAFEASARVRTLPLLSFIGTRLSHAVKLGVFEKPQTEQLNPVQEKAKLDAARRRELEDEEKLRRGEMHVLEDVEQKIWTDILAPTREGWLNLARLCDTQCNPENPAIARKVLESYAAQHLRRIHAAAPEELPADATGIANSDTQKPNCAQ